MSEASKTYKPATLQASRNVISSPESACGPTPLDGLGGQMIMPFGQGVAHASHSVRAGSGEASQIRVISGPHGTGSSQSVALTCSLASKLRAKTDLLGSTLFRLIWKERATPSGRVIYALRASGRRTSDSASTSWPTPDTMMGPHGQCGVSSNPKHQSNHDLQGSARLAAWPTPRTITGGAESGARKQELGRENSGGGDLQAVAQTASWATPKTSDGSGGRTTETKGGGNVHLDKQARLTGSGPPVTGSPAPTAKPGQLNPAHSRWLQGLPPDWCACAVTAMRSMPKSPRRLSKRTKQ